jgi:hypothetical protein
VDSLTAPSSPDKPYSQQNSRLNFISIGSIFLCFVSFSLTAFLLLLYPYGANYGEAPIMDQALHIAEGHNIYKPNLQLPPYVIANYTPIYPLLIGGVYYLTHLPLLNIGRTISILAAIASSMLLGALANKFFHSPIVGLLTASLFLGHPYVGLWSGLVRVDALALAFSLGGLWIVCTRWRSTAWLAIAIICLLASIFTRQTFLLAAPFACGVWLIRNDWKRGLTFLAALAFLGLAVFLIINSVTQGGFYQHIVTANVNTYTIGRTVSMGMLYLLIGPVLLFMAALTIRTSARQPMEPFLVWGFLPYTGGAFLTALTVGKIGSDINYFLEFTAAAAVWSAGIYRIKPGKPAAFMFLLHAIWAVTFSGLLFQAPLVKLWNNIAEVDAQARQVQAAVAQGRVLADDRLDLVVLAGQEIYFQPFEYTQMYSAGLWDTTNFEAEIARQEFSLILIRLAYQQERWPAPVYDTIRQYYTCILQTGTLVCKP